MWRSALLPVRVRRVLIIAVSWTFVLVVVYVNAWFLIGDLTRLGKLDGSYAFLPDFAGTVILGFAGGLAGGYLLVYRINAGRRRHSYISDIIRSGFLFIVVYLCAGTIILFSLAFLSSLPRAGLMAALRAGGANVVINLWTPSFVITTAIWGLLASATQFMLQVNDKFGPGVLWKLMTGRYYKPRAEERIFMFLDLQSSTSIAEAIGHERYFELLRDVYEDITEPITRHEGEIYQYIGDEVVLTWSPENGAANGNCIRCFVEIRRLLDSRRPYYLEQFGVVPSFKAGMHVGPATVGEIGVVKKDIVYSGDVLNTAARIRAECNRYDVPLLVSADLLDLVATDASMPAEPIGQIPLRGKLEPLAISAIRLPTGPESSLAEPRPLPGRAG